MRFRRLFFLSLSRPALYLLTLRSKILDRGPSIVIILIDVVPRGFGITYGGHLQQNMAFNTTDTVFVGSVVTDNKHCVGCIKKRVSASRGEVEMCLRTSVRRMITIVGHGPIARILISTILTIFFTLVKMNLIALAVALQTEEDAKYISFNDASLESDILSECTSFFHHCL